jgi:hypothetical protein
MTDLFAYHAAKDHMTDLRQTSGQTRLTTTANNHRPLTNNHRVISRVLSRISSALSIDHRTASLASHTSPITPDVANDPAGQTR